MHISLQTLLYGTLPLLALFLIRHSRRSSRLRTRKIPPHEEHVLILGASSGVGRVLAVQYARRGARVCLVARDKKVEAAAAECEDAYALSCEGRDVDKGRVIALVADFSNVEDMVRVRERLQAEWGRLDTLAVIAGVSSLKPLLSTAGVESGFGEPLPDADVEGLRESIRIGNAAMTGNFVGPYTAAITFLPFLSRTSSSPSVLLLSSVAAVVAAPTRALYGASKSASLILYQSLSIEHPDVHFTAILPATIEGDFRASAVDAGSVRESDPNKHGLKREVVAQRCIQAVDAQERNVFMAGFYRFVPTLYYTLLPEAIERLARKKYKYPQ